MEEPTAQQSIAFISSFTPRKCGIATFTGDLVENLRPAIEPRYQPFVVAMESEGGLRFAPPVEFSVRQNVLGDYVQAGNYINWRRPRVVSLQHEFGLFGGEGGSHIYQLLERLNAPLVTTLHTILENPTAAQRQSLRRVCACSDAVVVMNRRGLTMLTELYQVPARKVRLIPHGIPDLPPDGDSLARQRLGLARRRVILTFGLISRNKGIEVVLRAMPAIVRAYPDVLYLVVGTTHPEVVKHEGYGYVNQLHQLVRDLDLRDHVIFHDEFVSAELLKTFLQAAHIYVTPYLHKEQLTSGTLAFAVGTGNAVVSTPYWAAEELLTHGRGCLVPFGDTEAMASEIIRLFNNTAGLKRLQGRAYAYGRTITWPRVALAYRDLFLELSQNSKAHGSPLPRKEPAVALGRSGSHPASVAIAAAVLQGTGH